MRFATVLISMLALGLPGFALAHEPEHGHGDHGGCSCCQHGDGHHADDQTAKTDADKPAKGKAAAAEKDVKPPPEKPATAAPKQ